ncbi:vWA domain-containing protein [Mycobacterium sp. 94-17]|uniref:vWA domain-containing protein n=1 Tax=Mycobacterium sp. 94-17 TaxID=2986147 RepID=UPI002D1EA6A1|nr:vWA domain-containing protein [Mycobacterium sp. 94-17]MEB4208950.1 VWA domain-containing protein [Mycobacterium sp. 94-17]
MTNADLTLIAVLVDRSGSMAQCRDDWEGGLNTFVESQAEEPGDAEITLAQFDTEYELVWPLRPIKEAPPYTLVPRGATALLDAMGRFITGVGERLAKRDEADRPGKVIVCIVTDGMENSSMDWTRDQVKALVERQCSTWQWEFVFLGANMDAVQEGASVGIPQKSSLTFDAVNARAAYSMASGYVSAVRGGAPATFSDEDRKSARRHKSRG